MTCSKPWHVAEEVGLDFFGFGEHHTRSMPLSSPTALVNAAAASTHRIGLGTTVTVLSTDEPIRVFQQLATAAAIAPGRIEPVAGRGSSDITFPLFDLEVSDYDMLYRSKLDLLLKLNGHDRVTGAARTDADPSTTRSSCLAPSSHCGSGSAPAAAPNHGHGRATPRAAPDTAARRRGRRAARRGRGLRRKAQARRGRGHNRPLRRHHHDFMMLNPLSQTHATPAAIAQAIALFRQALGTN